MKKELSWPYWVMVRKAVKKIRDACIKNGGFFQVNSIECRQNHEEFTLNMSALGGPVAKAVIIYDFCLDNNPKDFLLVRLYFNDGKIWDVDSNYVSLLFSAPDKSNVANIGDKEVSFVFRWIAMKHNPQLIGELSSIRVDFIDGEPDIFFKHMFALNPTSRRSVIGFMGILAKEFNFDFQERIESDRKVSELLELSHIFDISEKL
jgi:hypothetical protein